MRIYLRELSYEVYDRTIRIELEETEERIAARREGFYGRLVQDVLERTDVVLQQLDRRIEGVSTRHGGDIRELREELAALRSELEELRRVIAGTTPPGESLPAGRTE